MIRIYEANTRLFENHGLGTVNPYKCIETKKTGLSGWYLECEVPAQYGDLVQSGRIVLAKTKERSDQPFRIDGSSIRRTPSRVFFTAKHVAYDADVYIVADARPVEKTAVGAAQWINERADTASPYTITGDALTESQSHDYIRRSLLDSWRLIETQYGCIADPFDWTIRFMRPESVGTKSGFKVAYGSNLQGYEVEEDWSSVCTKILPVGPNGITLDEIYLESRANYPVPFTKIKRFEDFENGEQTEEEIKASLRAKALEYLAEHKEPKIRYKIKSDVPQGLGIHDRIPVYSPHFTIDTYVTEYSYDVEARRVKSITFGNYDATSDRLADFVASTATEVADTSSRAVSSLQISKHDAQLQKLFSIMSNGLGMFVSAVDDGSGGKLYYYHDRPSLEDSHVVYTINSGGFAVSTDGGRTYTAGIDHDGNAVVNVLAAKGVSADWIETGVLRVSKGSQEVLYVDVDTGTVRIVADSFSLSSGQTLEGLETAQQGSIISKETLYLVTYGDTPTQNHVGWTKTPLALEPGQHLWAMEKTKYLSGQIVYSVPVDLTGPELVSSERYYKLSASSTSPNVDGLYFGNEFSFGNDTYLTEPGEREGLFLGFFLGNDTYLTVSPETLGWQSTYPEYIQDRYLWERWKFVYKDGTVLWSEPVVNRWYFDMSTDIAQHYEEMHTSFTQTNGQIALKADKTVVDANYKALTGEITRVEQAQEASLTIESARIQGIVSETIRETKSQIEQQYGEAIETAISTSERTLRSEITQTANSITLELTGSITTQVSGLRGDLETLSGTVSTNNTNYISQFELLQNQINARVTSTTLATTVNAINQSIELAKSEVEAEISASAEGITLAYQNAISNTESTLTGNYTTAIATAKSQIESGYAGAIATAKSQIEDDYEDAIEAAIEVSETTYNTELGLIRGQIAMKASQTELNARLDETGKLIDALRTEQSAQLNVATEGITAEISRLETKVDSNGNRIDSLDFARAYLKTDGLYVEDSLNPSKSQINGAGLKVIDTASNATVLEATADGVTAKQLTTKGEFTIDSDGLRLVQKKWFNSYDNEYGIGFFVTGN